MNICLVFPKTTVFEDPMVFPPLGLFWLRAVLESAGHRVTYIDMSEYEVLPDGARRDLWPDVTSLPLTHDAYLVSGTSPQAREIRKIGKYLREQGCITIVGGPHATNYAGSETKSGFQLSVEDALPIDAELVQNYHVAVKYEGEGAVLEALDSLDIGIQAMARHHRGIVLQRPNIADLGKIPIPSRQDALRYRYYLDDECGGKHRGTTMFTSRGCPERCSFCDSPGLWGRGVRYTPMHRVIEEFEQIRSLGFGAIQFYDDILPLHKGRLLEMCQELKRFEFFWRCFFRVDIMSHRNYGEELIHHMFRSGLREVLVGVESGSQRILDGIHKGTTVEQNTLVRAWCRSAGVRFKASVILGLPGESRESMEATRQWVLQNRPDRVNVCLFIPFTGTPISKSTEEKRKREYGTDAMHEYDIRWEMDAALLEEAFYAGSRTGLSAMVSTSHVSAAEITDFYHAFVNDLEAAGIPY